MPNWCFNNVDITATTDEQKDLLERVSRGEAADGFFDMFLPLPEILRDSVSPTPDNLDSVHRNVMIAQTGHTNWYDWCVANWGTKWDVEVMDCEFDGTTLSTSFDSAWSPPIAFYEYLKTQGFEVSANYYEPGLDFAGTWIDGEELHIDGVMDLARQDENTLSTEEYDILEMWNIWEEVAMMDELAEEE